jgi:hypothetical protein
MNKVLTIDELVEMSKKVWASVKDIEVIGNIGYNKARIIKKQIRDELVDQGWVLPRYGVPMTQVINHFPPVAQRLAEVGGVKHGRK